MANQTPTEFLRSLDYTRKPFNTEEIYTYINCERLLYSQLHVINSLPYIDAVRFESHNGFYTSVFNKYKHKDDLGRTIYHPQYWRTRINDVYYLIDNQGYDYARYVIGLRNYKYKSPELNFIPTNVQ